jgi:hypothetical protein
MERRGKAKVAYRSSSLILHYSTKVCFVNRRKKGDPTETIMNHLKRKYTVHCAVYTLR